MWHTKLVTGAPSGEWQETCEGATGNFNSHTIYLSYYLKLFNGTCICCLTFQMLSLKETESNYTESWFLYCPIWMSTIIQYLSATSSCNQLNTCCFVQFSHFGYIAHSWSQWSQCPPQTSCPMVIPHARNHWIPKTIDLRARMTESPTWYQSLVPFSSHCLPASPVFSCLGSPYFSF